MNPLIAVGLALVLNGAVFGGGVYWLQRQRRRLRAERAPDGFVSPQQLPPDGEVVQILVDDGSGMLAERAAVRSSEGGWADAYSQHAVEEDVVGWRPPPSRPHRRSAGGREWTPEEVAARLKHITDGDDR